MLQPGVTLYFVRHGETDWNRIQRYQGQTDVPLNDVGRAQAARNGAVLAQILGPASAQIDFVASPLVRAVETMSIARAAMGLAADGFATDPRLREQNFGSWEGLTWTELPTIDPVGFAARLADTWNWQPQGGENYVMLRERVAPWLAGLQRDTVAVSHGNVGRCVRGLILDLDPATVPRLEAPQDRVLRISNGDAVWL